MSDWSDFFDEIIIGRGYDYFERGNVGPIRKTKNGYRATVQGTYPYKVSVEMDSDGNFIDASCTCPYAEGGDYCKHEAALLFAIDDDIDGEEYDIDNGSLEEIVSLMTRENLEEFILSLAEENKLIREELLAFESDL